MFAKKKENEGESRMPEPTPAAVPDISERINLAASIGAPALYANSFIMGMSQGDVIIVFERNGTPVGTLNLSYTVTKSIAMGLNRIISDLEEKAGREILTSQDIVDFAMKSEA